MFTSYLTFLIYLTCELDNLHLVKGSEFASMLAGLYAQLNQCTAKAVFLF